jgi:hypothetical protein
MSYRRNWIAVMVVILGLAMFVPVAQAQRQEWEAVFCYAGSNNRVLSSPEAAVRSWDIKGIVRSTHESKLFDNFTFHSVGIGKTVGDKWSVHGLTKSMGPDGDFSIWEVYGDNESGLTSKAIYGTGKLKGIKGECKGKVLTTGKPIVQETFQACESWVGWIELPK